MADEVDELASAITDAHANGIKYGPYSLARWLLQAGYRAEARVRAEVAIEMTDTLDNKILRIHEMAEATRALADACRNAFADQPMPEAWRDLFARVDEAYAAVPSGTVVNPVQDRPGDPKDPGELLTDVIHHAMHAAGDAVIGKTFRTHAEEIRAAVTAAFELAAGNGLIRLTPRAEWPEWIVLQPPYDLFAQPASREEPTDG